MNSPEDRDALVAEVTDWIFPSGGPEGNEIFDVEGAPHPFSRDIARWALSQISDGMLTTMAAAVLGRAPVDVRRLIARRAVTHVEYALSAAGVRASDYAGDPADSLRELDYTLAFAPVIDAVIKAGGGAETWRHNSLLLWEAMETLGQGRSTGWRAEKGDGPPRDWLHADPDELDEASARCMLVLLGEESPDTKLVAFVRANLHRAPLLASVVVQRKTFDIEMLSTVLDSPSPSLRKGAL